MSERLTTPPGLDPVQDLPDLDPVQDEAELRRRAVKRIEDKRGLMAHTLAFIMVNTLIVVIWFMTGSSFFWPIIPILGWGIGLVFHAWDVIWPAAGERQIQAEMDRLRRGRV